MASDEFGVEWEEQDNDLFFEDEDTEEWGESSTGNSILFLSYPYFFLSYFFLFHFLFFFLFLDFLYLNCFQFSFIYIHFE